LLKFDDIKQYTRVVSNIRFPQDRERPYLLIFFPENSTLLDDYTKLGIRNIDVKNVVIPITKIPRTRLLSDTRKLYKSYKLFAFSTAMKFPSDKNLFFDLSAYLQAIDSIYKPTNYRQRSGFLIKNILLKIQDEFPQNYRKVLFYSINVTKNLNQFVNRKIFPIVQQLKDNDFLFDHMLLNIVSLDSSKYRVLIKDKNYQFSRLLQYVRNIKLIDLEKDEEVEVNKASTNVIKKVSDVINKNTSSKVQNAVSSYLKNQPDLVDSINSDELNDEEIDKLTVASILYQTSGDLEKSNRLSKMIPKDKTKTALKNVDNTYSDELLKPEKTISLSDNMINELLNIPKMVDDKSPEHLFQKRQIDFEINLKKDMENSFKVLERKEIPLKIVSMNIVDKQSKATEIDKSDISIIKTILKDEFGNTHEVEIEVPKIDKFGVFRLNGDKKILINQLVLCPITFPKAYDSKFESSYSKFHIQSKRTRKNHWLEIYMGSYKLSLFIVLCYSFGFENTIKKYNLKYKIVQSKPKKDEMFTKINENEYVVFENVDNDLKFELCESFSRSKPDEFNIQYPFGSKEYFNSLITKITGRVNSTYLLSTNLENIVDPVVKQILVNKQLPTELDDIMKYMASKVVTGFEEKRNDLSNQRIRNSEVLVNLAQKQILAAYTEYKEQVLSGNKNAVFNLVSDKVLRDFINSEIVSNMEYANPIEELSVMTRVSPVGKNIGGIPDKGAIQLEARNVHPSYFGNIDPLDTPEGSNVGIIQYLTVDALITSARGLFTTKDISDNEYSGMLSSASCMVPFIENNDGPRVMFSCSQARQALPLKNPSPPVIQSGYESILSNVLSDSFIKRSPCNGKVFNITKDSIIIICKNGDKHELDISPFHLKSGSGKDTLSVFKVKVKKGQIVKNNEIVAEGACVSGGSISLGRTLLVALMPYKGYNFEDGIVINERLVSNDMLTSLHGIIEEAPVSSEDRLLYICKIGEHIEKGKPLLRRSIGEIEELIGIEELEDENSEISSGQYIKKSPGGIVVDIEVFCNINEDKFPILQDLIKRTNKRYERKKKERFTIRGVSIKGVLIKFKIEQELKVQIGDKLCNRYGNKGIISLIEKDSLMPRTPWGETVDIILNPLGVIGRMNMGQIYELYCGLISKKLANIIIENNTKSKVVNILNSVLKPLDKSKGQKFISSLTNNISKMSDNKFKEMINQIKNNGFVPIIIPPFKAPSYKDILQCMKILNLKSGYYLKLPEFNTKTYNVVPIGYMYIEKMEHLASSKIHTRSTGPVKQKTLQPLSGKRREGGQRVGEQDTWALVSYNCPKILSEFFGPLSDDHVTKNEIISDIIQTGSAEYRESKSSPTRELLNSYFVSLMLGR